jgi:predicted nucleic acid-binding protein
VILLDTSVLVVHERLKLPLDEDYGVSAVAYGELAFGVAMAPDPATRAARHRRLITLHATGLEWLPYDEAAAEGYAELAAIVHRARPALARSKDIMIAGHAYALGATLATLNARDFALVRDHVPIMVPPPLAPAGSKASD